MKYKKRKSLKTIVSISTIGATVKWQTLLINAMVLPAHAQTSMCAEDQIVGFWSFREIDLFRGVRLDQGGVARLGDTLLTGSWQVTGNTLIIDLTPEFAFTGDFVDGDCARVISAPDRPIEVEGTKIE